MAAKSKNSTIITVGIIAIVGFAAYKIVPGLAKKLGKSSSGTSSGSMVGGGGYNGGYDNGYDSGYYDQQPQQQGVLGQILNSLLGGSSSKSSGSGGGSGSGGSGSGSGRGGTVSSSKMPSAADIANSDAQWGAAINQEGHDYNAYAGITPQQTDLGQLSGSDQLPYQSLDSGVGVVSSGYVPEASGYVASNGDSPGAVNYASSQTQDIGVDNSALYDANSAGLSDNSSFNDAANSDYFVSTDGWGDNSGDNYSYDS